MAQVVRVGALGHRSERIGLHQELLLNWLAER
jgi:hypothetical protein